MTPEQVESRFQGMATLVLEIGSGLARLVAGVLELNDRLARTEAIANSNARAIQANQEYSLMVDQKINKLADILTTFMEATNSRMAMAEN
jgi:hypothetical protein